jgi:hypothetical protein
VIVYAALLLVGALVAAVAWPLATYTLSLAAFGAAHVLVELRYVDLRFGRRLGSRLRRGLALLLAALVVERVARCSGVLAPGHADLIELGLGLALVLSVAPALARRGGMPIAAAVVTAAGLLLGLCISPMHTMLAVAIIHNATPLGFLVEATSGCMRGRAVVAGVLVFAAIPLLIATGAPWALASTLGIGGPEAAVLPAGPLEHHMRAYLPRQALPSTWALHAFAAFTFMQCAHYVVVIAVLPRLLVPGDRGVVPWPAWPRFGALVGLAAALTLIAFARDFAGARAWYGVAAAVHAWIELPLLLLAMRR